MILPHVMQLATDFVRAHAARVKDPEFDVGDPRLVKACLTFHALQGTLALEWHAPGGPPQLAGLAIVWQDFESRLLRLAARNENLWQWQASAPGGDCLYLGLVMTTDAAALPRLARYFAGRFPSGLPQYCYRRGRLVVRRGLLERLAEPRPQPDAGPVQTLNHELIYG